MFRPPKLTLYALLALMQIIAPWVHAHTGAETGSGWHIPGLEFLSKDGQSFSTAGESTYVMDRIVGIPAGVWSPASLLKISATDGTPAAVLPVRVEALQPHSFTVPISRAPPALPRSALPRHDAVPRAPPSLFRISH
jgi:hypothetical protein